MKRDTVSVGTALLATLALGALLTAAAQQPAGEEEARVVMPLEEGLEEARDEAAEPVMPLSGALDRARAAKGTAAGAEAHSGHGDGQEEGHAETHGEAAGAQGEAGHGEGKHGPLGARLPIWSVIPFIGILLSIAILPLLAPSLWHHHFGKISAGWAVLFCVPFVAA